MGRRRSAPDRWGPCEDFTLGSFLSAQAALTGRQCTATVAVSVKAWTNSPRDRTAAAGVKQRLLTRASPLRQNGARRGDLSSPAFPGTRCFCTSRGRIGQAEDPRIQRDALTTAQRPPAGRGLPPCSRGRLRKCLGKSAPQRRSLTKSIRGDREAQLRELPLEQARPKLAETGMSGCREC